MFTHLHTHTEYSLLDGSGRIPEMIAQAKALGMNALSITDHGVMYGVIDFYKEARKAGIKPIIGCEVYVTPGSRFDREKERNGEDKYHHLVLLCENNQGYQNLMKLCSKAFLEGFYYKPRVDYELLSRYHEGLIASSACLAGEVQKYIVRGMYEEAKKAALHYQQIFGEGNFFLELQDHGLPDQKTANAGLMQLHNELHIPLIATNDIHYTYKEDAEPHDILLCIQTGKHVSDTDRMRYTGGQYYMKSEEEMRSLFPYAPEAIDNTQKIADRCNVEIEFGVTKLPKFAVPGGRPSEEYLRELCYEGLARRYPKDDGSLRQRMDYELSVIEKMGYVDYFLIVSDFIHYAKSHDIPVGPGRGSAAGSIVAYCLEITDIDPIRYSLLFERFLNPERVSMPDIDVDFCYERRQEVIDYVVRTYGKDDVAQIVTFGTMAAKGVVRDVGRVLDLPYAKCDAIAKMIPGDLGMTLQKALKLSPDLKKAYAEDPEVTYLIDMSLRLEGLPRHTSMHAAGVLIARTNVDEYVPLARNQDGTVVTQYTMTTLEELGLLKMDFLGLRTLTVIKNAQVQAERNYGVHIDINRIDYGDPKVYEMISRGDTAGVFQLESAGMTSFMKELKPESIDDIIAGLSLYRPGPMDFIPRYIKGKNNRDTVTYECPELEPILKSTYGCIVYQEQVMQIVQKLAGYSLGRADLVRRAMSKKKAEVMQKERQNFIYGNLEEGVPGCIRNGIPEETASRIFDEMTDFASYAFNKSHAAAYAVVSYQTAWLKCYYPAEYMAALMTSVIDNLNKTSEYIQTCRKMGLRIQPPDINRGDYGFTAEPGEGGSILYGLSAIKGVGRSVVEEIVEERQQNGPFTDMEDFITRMQQSVNRKAMEYFIKAGAFDCFPGNRCQKINILGPMIDKAASARKSEMSGQMSLFDLADEGARSDFRLRMPELPEFDKETLLAYEKEATGLYISGHPIESYLETYRRIVNTESTAFRVSEETGTCSLREGQQVVCGGVIEDLKTKITKNGNQMCFLSVGDLYGQFEAIVFPNVFERVREALHLDAKVYLSGHVSIEADESGKLIADKVVEFDRLKKELWIAFSNREAYEEKKERLEELCYEHPGSSDVIIYLRKERAVKKLPADLRAESGEEFLKILREKFSEKNVKVVEKALDPRA